MDIYLLSQLIKELLPVKGSLTLPRIGVFGTEDVPAFFSENGRVINPPSKKIIFSSDFDQSDTAIVEEYAAKIGAGADELKEQSETFFSGLLSEKYRTGSIIFPGFGRLDFTNEGTASFELEGTQDPFSGRYGLEPLNLRKIDTRDIEDEEYLIPSDTFGESVSAGPAEPESAAVQHTVPGPLSEPAASAVQSEGKAHRRWIVVVSILLCVLIMAIVIIVTGRNGSLDSLLYSEEELRLIESAGSGK